MSRIATIIGQCRDHEGRDWDIREERITAHGWPLLLGWPADTPRGQGGGGVRIIPTAELMAYLKINAFRPAEMELPCGKTAIKRLRRLACLYWLADSPQWWTDRKDDLLTLTLSEFCKKHGVSVGAASQWRKQLRKDKDKMESDDITVPEAAQALEVSESWVRRLCREKRLPAKKIGRDWFINRLDLKLVRNLKPGPKPKEKGQD